MSNGAHEAQGETPAASTGAQVAQGALVHAVTCTAGSNDALPDTHALPDVKRNDSTLGALGEAAAAKPPVAQLQQSPRAQLDARASEAPQGEEWQSAQQQQQPQQNEEQPVANAQQTPPAVQADAQAVRRPNGSSSPESDAQVDAGGGGGKGRGGQQVSAMPMGPPASCRLCSQTRPVYSGGMFKCALPALLGAPACLCIHGGAAMH